MNLQYHTILGEEDLKGYFRSAVRTGNISHAYILSGETGSGKRMIAEAFAAALLCKDPLGGEACGQCESCRRFQHHSHPDLVEIIHENPNLIAVNEVREQLVNVVNIGPMEANYKVYLIEDAEKMNAAAQNAILKTIEEPPQFAVILLLTNNLDACLPTILSRCVKLETKPVAEEVIKQHLMKYYNQTDYTAAAGAAFAQGNVGRAIELIQSEEFNEKKEKIIRLMQKLMTARDYEFEEEIKELKDDKEHIEETLNLMTIWFRDVLLYKATGSDQFLIFHSERSLIRKQSVSSSYAYLVGAFREIQNAREKLKSNVNFELTMSLMLMQLKEIQNG